MQQHLETLRKKYHSTKVTVWADSMVYFNIPNGQQEKVEKELNDLIKELKLPLVAKKSSGIFADTITVEYLIK